MDALRQSTNTTNVNGILPFQMHSHKWATEPMVIDAFCGLINAQLANLFFSMLVCLVKSHFRRFIIVNKFDLMAHL